MKYASILASAACALATGGLTLQAGAASVHKLPSLSLHAPKWLADSSKNSIVGTWQVAYDGGVHNTITQWAKGGTTTQLADFPPKTGNNIIIGDWKKNDDGTVSAFLSAWVWDDKGNNLVNTFTKSETETLSGNSYTGAFEVIYYDLDGNIVFDHTGTLAATRITGQ